VLGNKERIYVSYPDLHADVTIGNTIMINDGKAGSKGEKNSERTMMCRWR
jgi:pyruvate kinase